MMHGRLDGYRCRRNPDHRGIKWESTSEDLASEEDNSVIDEIPDTVEGLVSLQSMGTHNHGAAKSAFDRESIETHIAEMVKADMQSGARLTHRRHALELQSCLTEIDRLTAEIAALRESLQATTAFLVDLSDCVDPATREDVEELIGNARLALYSKPGEVKP